MAIASDELQPLALAGAAHAQVGVDATRAATMAASALSAARTAGERDAEVAALHALGYAQHDLGDPRAVATLRSAVRIGEAYGLRHRTALARRTLAGCLAEAGAVGPALREIDLACQSLGAHEQARTEVFRIGVLYLAGRAPASLADSDAAVRTLRRKGDTIWEARLLQNRGGLLQERGDVGRAELDLKRAQALYEEMGATADAQGIAAQLAMIALLRGDLAICLQRLDAIADDALPPYRRAALELWRAQSLAAGRLMAEATAALTRAQEILRHARVDDHEVRLQAIRLTLLASDSTAARSLARAAQRAFAAQGRPIHRARAIGQALAAEVASGTVRTASLRSGRDAVRTLAAAGWQLEASRIQLSVARAAIELGAVPRARRELSLCARSMARGPIADRIEVHHVEALIRLGEGDRAGAQRSARSGLRLLEQHRAALGASDLRATASSIGSELAQLGLRIALHDDHPGPLFDWAEALRGSALRLTPVTPPKSPALRRAMTELRQVGAQIGQAEAHGRSTRALLTRQSRLENEIRRISRHAAGNEGLSRSAPKRAQIGATLGPRALVEYIELDGHLTAVTFADGRLARHPLGSVAGVTEQLEWLRFGLTRLTRVARGAPQAETLLAGAQASASALDEQLLVPLAPVIGEREVVIVPTGALHDLPWAMLPSLRGRPIVVSPSAATWWALQTAPRRRRKIVAVAGPRLRQATPEIKAVAALYPGAATPLTGTAATTAATMRALDGATVAHLACHGRFRADSPLFSSLELADGPLNVYELQGLRRAPELIVLSACDLAVSDTHPGDELLGLAAALLDMGTRTVIASVMPVPDAMAKRLMLSFHRRLIAGERPASALAGAQSTLSRAQLALTGFVCLGTG